MNAVQTKETLTQKTTHNTRIYVYFFSSHVQNCSATNLIELRKFIPNVFLTSIIVVKFHLFYQKEEPEARAMQQHRCPGTSYKHPMHFTGLQLFLQTGSSELLFIFKTGRSQENSVPQLFYFFIEHSLVTPVLHD